MARPLRSSPITEPSTLLPDGPPLCPTTGTRLLRFLPLETFPETPGRRPHTTVRSSRRTTGSHVPYKSLTHARAAYMPDTVWPINRHPPDSSRDKAPSPGFDVIKCLSTLHLRFTLVRLHWVIPDALKGTPFPTTLPTTALDRSSLRVVCDHSLQSDHGGPTSISCTATHQRNTPHFLFLLVCFFLRSWRTVSGPGCCSPRLSQNRT
jgi:hypothetical protein